MSEKPKTYVAAGGFAMPGCKASEPAGSDQRRAKAAKEADKQQKKRLKEAEEAGEERKPEDPHEVWRRGFEAGRVRKGRFNKN